MLSMTTCPTHPWAHQGAGTQGSRDRGGFPLSYNVPIALPSSVNCLPWNGYFPFYNDTMIWKWSIYKFNLPLFASKMIYRTQVWSQKKLDSPLCAMEHGILESELGKKKIWVEILFILCSETSRKKSHFPSHHLIKCPMKRVEIISMCYSPHWFLRCP